MDADTLRVMESAPTGNEPDHRPDLSDPQHLVCYVAFAVVAFVIPAVWVWRAGVPNDWLTVLVVLLYFRVAWSAVKGLWTGEIY